MISDYYVNLHFNQAIAQRTGYAFKIGDKGCTFHFHCEDLDPSGMYPHIVFNHPNNTCVEGVPTGSGRDYAYTIQGNEFAVIGKTVVDLKFYDALDATQRISTASFIIEILPDTYTPFEEASSSYADSLERAREEIDAAIIELQGAEHDLEEAETDLGNMSEQFADTLQDYIDAFGNTGPINPRGDYDDDTPYVPRDAVSYTAAGKTLTYINKQACTGIAPTDPDYGAQYWQIMIDVAVGGALSALEDVSIDPQTLADGQMLTYNNTDDVWENKTILENSLTSTATDKALTAAKGKELQDNKQDKELETPITVAGTSKTTVEDALDGINAYVDDVKEDTENELSHKNLFDNPWFTVNQRGFTSHTMNGAYFPTVDRWIGYSSSGGVLTLGASGINFNKEGYSSDFYLTQKMEELAVGKVYTLSVLFSDGTIEHATGTINSTSNKVEFAFSSLRGMSRVYYYSPWSKWVVDIIAYADANFTVRAIKLEIGSVSTLANDVEPNYATELLKCRRYFKRIWDTQYSAMGICQIRSNAAYFVYQDGVPMRATPTMSHSGTFVIYSNGDHTATGLTLDTASNKDVQVIYASADFTGAGDCGYGFSSSPSGYVDLNAEL